MDDDWGYPYDSGNLHLGNVNPNWLKFFWEIMDSPLNPYCDGRIEIIPTWDDG